MARNGTSEPLRGALIAVVAAAIGAGGTLVGNSLAAENAREQLAVQLVHDDRVREHDARRDAYQRFIFVASDYELDLVRLIAKGAEDTEAIDSLIPKLTQLQTALGEVQLAAGRGEATGLAKAVFDELDMATGEGGSPSVEEVTSTVGPLLGDFIEAARAELNRKS
jgi:hypothetical protein